MLIIDLVKTVYIDLKKRQIMAEKLAADKEIVKLQEKKRDLQTAYENLENKE